MTNISPEDFQFYQALLLKESGLALNADKTYLLSTRLTPVAASLGYKTLDHFTAELRNTPTRALVSSVVEAMTTNETSFFRDTKPFTMLRELLPGLIKSRERQKTIRIWSAACSSGQECYSIAMLMDEFFADKPGWRYQIVGTDISQDILAQAARGEYSQFEVQRGLSIQMMVRYFKQEDGKWRVNDTLRQNVKFQYANLLENFSHLGMFDIVFCRNVLIYFNNETKSAVLSKMAPVLATDGFLFLGACETMLNLDVPFESMPGRHGILQRKRLTKAADEKAMDIAALGSR